jgi:uncharacterized protein (DUF885 family)
MPDTTDARAIADRYVAELADLDPIISTKLGLRPDEDRLPDLSPAGHEALMSLSRSTLAELAAAPPPTDQDDRRCAKLLEERLEAGLAMSEQGEQLRAISNLFGPPQRMRNVFLDMPAATAGDWAVIARRMAKLPQALAGYRESLSAGIDRGLIAGPRVVTTVIGQFGDWAAAGDGSGWFAEFAASAPVTPGLEQATQSAIAAIADLRDWLKRTYLPLTANASDQVGAERYQVCARSWIGANLDVTEAYEWGWSQFQALRSEMQDEAKRIVPGASVREAMTYLDDNGEAVEGVDAIRDRLQQMMNDAIADLDGTHFDIAEPVKTVEARIAPAGSAAAPYYTSPSRDFVRPGRTWLPVEEGRTRFPLWNLVSTWYHEGVPGHHLQIAQGVYLADQLSIYQTSVGGVSASSEGWALYAERLMDELGYLRRTGDRLGYLDAQMARAIRVVIDIGMHTRAKIPADSPVGAGQTWTPELAREFFGMHNGSPAAFCDSEIIRYLSQPGQAISYKLGERAWLAGRDAAKAAHGPGFDLKAWHMGALSLGALGLDDLAVELAAI